MANENEKEEQESLETVAFNLSKENITWLKKVNDLMQRKSVSNTLNYILNNLRVNKTGVKYV